MQAVVFIVVAVILYVAADRILERIEVSAGRRFEHRTLYFFGILLGLGLVIFPLIERFVGH